VGSTSSVPTRVGEGETVAAGLAVGAEVMSSHFDRSGRLEPSSLRTTSLLPQVGLGYAFKPQVQASVVVPGRVNWHTSDTTRAMGGGLGDVRASVLWDPLMEQSGRAAWPPVPLFDLGIRAPTGRDWTEASGTLGEDVTGREEVGLQAGALVERAMGDWPWMLGVRSEVGVGAEYVPLTLTAYGSLGTYIGTRWTLAGVWNHQVSWAGAGGRSTRNLKLGLRAIHGKRLAWRMWAGIDGTPPISGLGAGVQRTASASAGFLLVR